MADGDQVQIPLSSDEATKAVDELIDKLTEADDMLKRLQEDARKAFQQATSINVQPGNLPSVVRSYTPAQLPSAVSPEFAAAFQQLQQRQATLAAAARTFAQTQGAGFQPGAAPTQNLTAFQSFAAMSGAPTQRLTPGPSAAPGYPPITGRQPMALAPGMGTMSAAPLGRQPAMTGGFHPAAPPTQPLGAPTRSFAGPAAGPLSATAAGLAGASAASAASAAAAAVAGANAVAQAMPGAGGKPMPVTIAGNFAQVLGRVLSTHQNATLMAVLRGSAGIAGGGFSVAGAGLGLLGQMATFLGPAGMLGVGGAAAGVGLGLAASATQAQFYRRQALLQSSLFGAPDTSRQQLLSPNAVNLAGQAFNYDQGQANRTAVQLAMSGVQQNQLLGGLSTTFAMGRMTGMGPDLIAPLTSALMVQAGQSHEQVAAVFQAMLNGAKESGVAVNRLVQDMKDLVQETGNASINIAGLTAVQKTVGSAINVGQLMAPSLGTTGAGGLAAAAILGVSPGQFMQMQQNPAAMWDAIGQMSRRFAGQGATGTLITEQILQSAGLMDFTGVGPSQAARVVGLLQSGRPGAAQQMAAQIGRQSAGQQLPERQWLGRVAVATEAQTSALDRLTIAVNNLWTAIVTGQTTLPTTGAAPIPGALGAPGSNTTGGRWHPTPPGSPGQPGPPPTASSWYQDPRTISPHAVAVPTTHGTQYATPQMQAFLMYAAQQEGLPYALALAMAGQESGFNPYAVNPRTGAAGLMQMLPSTLADVERTKGSPVYGMQGKALNPTQQAEAGLFYLREVLVQDRGNLRQALSQYGGDPTGAYASAILGNAQTVSQEIGGTLDITGTVDINGQPATIHGRGTLRHAAVTHHTNPHRPPAGHTSHGPAHQGTPHGGRGPSRQ